MDILPTRATTATAIITRIVYGNTACAYIRKHGERKPVSIQKAQEIILNYRAVDIGDAAEVIFELPIDWLKGNIELRDTLGMDDSAQNGLLEAIALNTRKYTDLCVLVYDACQFFSAREREITQKVQNRLGGNAVFAINRTNLLNSLDGLKQVEKTAQAVIGDLGNELVGKGRYYLMCSAPGLIELDGFDAWLKGLLLPANEDKLNSLRKCSASFRIAEAYSRATSELNGFMCQIGDYSEKLKAEHRRRIDKKRKNIRNALHSKRTQLNEERMNAEGFLCDTSELAEYLYERRAASAESYASFSRQAVCAYYTERAEKAFSIYCPYMKIYGYEFVSRAIDDLSFPDKHSYQTTTRSRGGKLSGATIGMLIGGIVGSVLIFGVGTLIGAGIGRFIGKTIGTKTISVDDSIPNTVRFVQNDVNYAIKTVLAAVFNCEYFRCSSIGKEKRDSGFAGE